MAIKLLKLTHGEALSISLAAGALLVSVISAYLQFLYVQSSVTATLLTASTTNTSVSARIAVVNSSSQEIAVMDFRLALLERNSGQHQWPSVRYPKHDPELPIVLPPKSIRILNVESPIEIAKTYSSEAAFDVGDRDDLALGGSKTSTMRKIHVGIIAKTLDVRGRERDAVFHVWTEYIEPSTTVKGSAIENILDLLDPKDARNKDWSYLRPLPTP